VHAFLVGLRSVTIANEIFGSLKKQKYLKMEFPDLLPSNNGTGNEFPRCVLDRSILNEDTIGSMENVGLSLFAILCGKNR
jgi:hypothetical protein